MALKKVKGNFERMFDKNLTDLVRGIRNNKDNEDLNSQNQYDAGVALSGLSCFISPDLSRDLANDIMTLMSSTKPYLRMKAVLMMYKVFLRYPEALKPAFPKLKEKLEDPDPGVQSAAVNVVCELARKNPKNYLPLAPVFFKLMTTSTNNWMLIKIIKLFGALTPLEPRLGKKLIEPLTNLIHRQVLLLFSFVFLCCCYCFTSAMSLLYECINTVIAVLISISSGMPNHSASIQLCVQKLRILIEDSDQNLKYLGLLAMSKILKTHPKSVQAHKDLILACLDDKDESIRLRALDLLYGMVSKKNLMEIVKRLLGHMERAEGSAYRDELLYKVIEICSQSSYLFVTNFEWYLTVLVELIQLEAGSKHGRIIAEQLLDVAIRVPIVRQFAVNEMANLLDTFIVSSQSNSMYEVLYAAAWIVGEFSNELENVEPTLNVLLKPRQVPGHIQGVFVQNVMKLFTRLATTYMENGDANGLIRLCDQVLDKLQSFNSSNDIEVQERAHSACILLEMLRAQFDTSSSNYTCVEIIDSGGAAEAKQLNHISTMAIEIVQEMALLFAGELIPVAPKAQRKVPLPDGLDLDEWINPPPEDESSSSSQDEKEELFVSSLAAYEEEETKRRKSEEMSPEQIERQRMQRLIEQSNNPHYLKSFPSTPEVGQNARPASSNNSQHNADQYDNLDDIPITELSLDIPLKVGATKRSDQYLMQEKANAKEKKKHKKSKKSKKSKTKTNHNSSTESEEEPTSLHVVNTTLDMPEGVALSDGEEKDKQFDPDDPHRALDIELDIPDLELPKYRSGKSQKKYNPDALENVPKSQISMDSAHKKEKKKSKDKEREREREKEKHRKSTSKKLQITEEVNDSANLLGISLEELQIPSDSTVIENEENVREAKPKSQKKSHKSNKELKDVDVVSSTKKKKNKSDKHDNRHHRDKKKSHKSSNQDYEEAVGISTPSKEIF
uniref:AP-3 complex subunit delta n=1 Tax=Glossina morsitans morsitans TaxID=37546 RepID=A0A1B0FQ33_GLOMM